MTTAGGMLEIDNIGRMTSALGQQLQQLFHDQAMGELVEALPDPAMQASQQAALAAYWSYGFTP